MGASDSAPIPAASLTAALIADGEAVGTADVAAAAVSGARGGVRFMRVSDLCVSALASEDGARARGGGERELADVIGAEARGGVMCVHAYPLRGRRRRYCPLRVVFGSAADAEHWAAEVNARLPTTRPRSVLVLVNPASGSGGALRTYRRAVAPLLARAGVRARLVETTHAGHAFEVARAFGVERGPGGEEGGEEDVVCVVSGDGLLHEVINGLAARPDHCARAREAVPLAVVPGGSGNAVAMSLLDGAGVGCTPTNAAFALARGHTVPADLMLVSQGRRQQAAAAAAAMSQRPPLRAVLSSTWGLISDVDIESETLRWMGGVRLTLYGLWRILRLRTYSGRVYFLPKEGEEVGKGQGAVACGRPSGAQGAGTAHAATSSELSDMEAGFSGGNADGAWRVVEGPLLFVWVKNTQWDAEDVKPAPRARLADGCVDLLYMRAPVSRWRLLRLFLQLESGSHVGKPGVHYVKCRRVVLEAGAPSTRLGGHVNVDGELLTAASDETRASQGYGWDYGEDAPVDIGVEPKAATLVAPERFRG